MGRQRPPAVFRVPMRGALHGLRRVCPLICTQANVRLEGGEKGVSADWDLILGPVGGVSRGGFSSSDPAAAALPERGRFQASWQAIDIALLRPLIAERALDLQGRLNGNIQGRFLGASRFEAQGRIDVTEGRISTKVRQTILSASIRNAGTDFAWKNEAVQGALTLELVNYGRASGTFQLPLPARIPLKMRHDGAHRIPHVGGRDRDGTSCLLLSGDRPGEPGAGCIRCRVPGGRGKARTGMARPGWRRPAPPSPRMGIRLEDASAEAEWIGDRVRIQSFLVRSGASVLRGSGSLWLSDWRIVRYEGAVNGERFQTVYLPEMRVWTSPDLRFSGTAKKLTVRGDVRIPEALIQYAEPEGVVRSSRDVVLIDVSRKGKKAAPLALDARIGVTLGEKVEIRAAGLQARLGGRVVLSGQDLDVILTDGQIETVKGSYNRYGVKLDIVRGHVSFKKEPSEMGNLDILALKKVRDAQKSIDVEAGVTITGPLRAPLVKLYGRPSMSDADVVSYMVLGRAYQGNTSSSQKEQIAQWAGALFAGSPSSSFPRQLRERLGIDTVGLESSASGGMSRSLVTIGKYLSPDLYVAFGRSLFGDDTYVSTRYSFLKNWQIESKVGLQSGADLFYRIEFD